MGENAFSVLNLTLLLAGYKKIIKKAFTFTITQMKKKWQLAKRGNTKDWSFTSSFSSHHPCSVFLLAHLCTFPSCFFVFPSIHLLSPSIPLLNLFICIKKHEAYLTIWCLSLEWISGSKQYIRDKLAKWPVIYWYALACYPMALSRGITDTEPSLISCRRCF